MTLPVRPTRAARARRLATVSGIALAALSGLSLLPATGAAVGGPPIVGVPPIHLPQPDQKAVFDVIVEGKATDHNSSELTGQDAACLVNENATVDETDTYLRGKGVRIEFDRYGATIIMKRNRGGQLGDTSLAVKVTVRRTAEGTISYVPAVPQVTCPPASDVSKNPDCGKSKPVAGSPALLLGWQGGRLSLDVTRKTHALSPPNHCGEDDQTGITDQLHWAWPFPAKLSAVQALATREIFNRRIHAIAITLLSSPADLRPGHTVHWGGGQLVGTVTDAATNRATVRLIRVG